MRSETNKHSTASTYPVEVLGDTTPEIQALLSFRLSTMDQTTHDPNEIAKKHEKLIHAHSVRSHFGSSFGVLPTAVVVLTTIA